MPFSKVRNLTPHPIHLVGSTRTVQLLPAGPPARLVLADDIPDGSVVVDGLTVPLVRTAATPTVVNLPDPEPGVLLIVARPVADALPHRQDLAYPHQVVRDDHGIVIGCRALGRPSPCPTR